MKINQIAQLTDLSAKTIRFYEEKGLLTPPIREQNGYRSYTKLHIKELNLIKRSREVGFSLDDCQYLLILARNPKRKSADVKEKARLKLIDIDTNIAQLKEAKKILTCLVDACPGDEKEMCPILDALTD